GADLRVVVAHSPDAKWAFLKANSLPASADQSALETRILNSTRNGVFIDLSDASNSGAVHSGAHGFHITTGGNSPPINDPALRQRIQDAIQQAAADAGSNGAGVSVSTVAIQNVIGADGQPIDPDSLPQEARDALANSSGSSVTARNSFKIGFSISSS